MVSLDLVLREQESPFFVECVGCAARHGDRGGGGGGPMFSKYRRSQALSSFIFNPQYIFVPTCQAKCCATPTIKLKISIDFSI